MINEKFWLAIAFLTFVILIIKFVGPLISRALDSKSKQIAEEILIAKELKEKAQRLLDSAEKYYKESVTFAQKIITDAEDEAKKIAVEAKQNLESEISKKTSAAMERIKLEEESAIREIKSKIVNKAMEGLGESLNLDQKNHEQILDKAAQNFEKILH